MNRYICDKYKRKLTFQYEGIIHHFSKIQIGKQSILHDAKTMMYIENQSLLKYVKLLFYLHFSLSSSVKILLSKINL